MENKTIRTGYNGFIVRLEKVMDHNKHEESLTPEDMEMTYLIRLAVAGIRVKGGKNRSQRQGRWREYRR